MGAAIRRGANKGETMAMFFDKDGKESEAREKAANDIVDATGAWFDSLIGRYNQTLDKAATGITEMAKMQQAVLTAFVEEAKNSENVKGRNVFQREFMKTFLLAGLELYQESREQRQRMQNIEEKLLKKLKETIDNVAKETKRT